MEENRLHHSISLRSALAGRSRGEGGEGSTGLPSEAGHVPESLTGPPTNSNYSIVSGNVFFFFSCDILLANLTGYQIQTLEVCRYSAHGALLYSHRVLQLYLNKANVRHFLYLQTPTVSQRNETRQIKMKPNFKIHRSWKWRFLY